MHSDTVSLTRYHVGDAGVLSEREIPVVGLSLEPYDDMVSTCRTQDLHLSGIQRKAGSTVRSTVWLFALPSWRSWILTV